MRAQLMIRLQEQVRALWADQLHPEDVIRIYTVRPTPAPEPGGQPRLHLIVEGNRPAGSQTRPVLLTFPQLTVDGPEPDIYWSPAVVGPTINLQSVAD